MRTKVRDYRSGLMKQKTRDLWLGLEVVLVKGLTTQIDMG